MFPVEPIDFAYASRAFRHHKHRLDFRLYGSRGFAAASTGRAAFQSVPTGAAAAVPPVVRRSVAGGRLGARRAR
jgi:hypothetical protein